MAFDIRFSYRSHFTVAEVLGEATLANFTHLIAKLHMDSKEKNYRRVLVNLQRTVGVPAFTEQFRIGEMVARRLSHMERVASVVRAEDRTGTSQKVAQAMKMELRVFTDTEAAADWLLSDLQGFAPHP